MHEPKKRWYEYLFDCVDLFELLGQLGSVLVELVSNVVAFVISAVAGLFS